MPMWPLGALCTLHSGFASGISDEADTLQPTWFLGTAPTRLCYCSPNIVMIRASARHSASTRFPACGCTKNAWFPWGTWYYCPLPRARQPLLQGWDI